MKTYLRYVLHDTFGVIASTQSNAVFDKTGNLAITAALQEVAVWNLRQGTLLRMLKPEGDEATIAKGQVSYLALSPNGRRVAAGYTTGVIRVYDVATGAMAVAFNGHKSAVTAARFNDGGALLISGGADTDVILWDMVAERGECRLRGHRDGVTDVAFLPAGGALARGAVSCSKDTLVKIWDLETQHCVQTVVGHRSEVWSLDVSPDGTRLVTAATDAQLRVWSIAQAGDAEQAQKDAAAAAAANDGERSDMLVAVYMGSVLRAAADGARAARVRYHAAGALLAVQGGGGGRAVELLRVRGAAEAAKKRRRRVRRHREKAEKRRAAAAAAAGAEGGEGEGGEGEEGGDEGAGAEGGEASDEVIAGDELEALAVVRSAHKTRDGRGARVLLALHNNSLELWSVAAAAAAASSGARKRSGSVEAEDAAAAAVVERMSSLDAHGHRSDVRAVAISGDDQLIASVSKGEAKVWNARTRQCIRTTPCGFGLCCAFAPGDRHLLVGTKEGRLQVVDLASGDRLWDYEAHAGAIWSLDVRPDGVGMATGSADGQVKFWEFEVAKGNLAVVHTRTLKMADDVLCVRYSRGRGKAKRLIAVAVLDATVKVFHEDTLKFFLSLYGHKLPVMSMDMSDDGTLLATGSADKTVKLWGLDFGDCHRSLHAHSDSVMGLRFVRNTHLFFTASKDKTLKYWDGDRFEKVLTMEGNQAEVWGLAVAGDGSFVLSGGHDRSLRVWERTEDMVFLEEEREKELEGMFDAELDRDSKVAAEASGAGPGELEGESAAPGRRTMESVLAGERLLEALDLVVKHGAAARAADRERRRALRRGLPAPAAPPADPMLLGLAPDDRFLRELVRVRAADLEQAIMVLPLAQVEPMAACLSRLLARGLEVELCARCAASMAAGPASMAVTLEQMRLRLRQRLEQARDAVGSNMAGLQLLRRRIDERKNAFVMESEEDRLAKRMRKAAAAATA
ncbi:WD40-repeat-containing domain protein [Tribonema minus]|uniref:WD40-repeat-containing domain protein n=1 Tax=Tribonema minus TaxID=303371 RepID=A0A835Z9P3_9STRA|nr:WD40-repeat-containing domain protein [Tribonema minus]